MKGKELNNNLNNLVVDVKVYIGQAIWFIDSLSK